MHRVPGSRRPLPPERMTDQRRRRAAWFETVEHLTQLADDAYALARAEVFDREPPGADPRRRTFRQRALVAKLELVERELAEARRDRYAAAG